MGAKIKKFKPANGIPVKRILIWVAVFGVIGLVALVLTRGATPVTVDASLPNPTNVQAYGDDRVATIMWREPSNANSAGIVGYYVTWGDQSAGVYTSSKQTTFNATQIQPLTNGVLYNVKVQSVHGSYVQVSTPGGETSTASEARASGRVSTGVVVTTTPSAARVDQLRSQMTGFFDDFNTPAGPFDELKWNHAASGCTDVSGAAAFVNGQFHSHNQVRSGLCDRSQIATRPRAVFDITGKTEANPGVVVMDMDGITRGRDIWYLDFIPLTARKSGVPIDIPSHSNLDDSDASDPSMLRFAQRPDTLTWRVYDANKNPRLLANTFACPGGATVDLAWCSDNTKVPGLSPIPEAPAFARIDQVDPNYILNPNVRHHWRWEISPTKLKLFINGTRVMENAMPPEFANTKQFVLHSNIFSYNTGKGDSLNPRTSMLHWDNFGFNGPAPSTKTHNYLDGGPTGTTPYLGLGTTTSYVSDAPRNTKIPIPDSIGSPTQARIHFTLSNLGPANYIWSSSDHIMINGNRYNFLNPTTNSLQPPILQTYYGPLIAEAHTPFSDSIIINPAHLRQGTNDISLNIGQNIAYMGVYNVHIELDYPSASQQSYTQPKDIFGLANLMSFMQPPMASHDNYLFVEQNMGLDPPTGHHEDPPADTTSPTVSLTAPSNGSTHTGNVTISANATDNVGIDVVEFYEGSTKIGEDDTSPYSITWTTTSANNGSKTITAKAYDIAGNSATSSGVTVTINNTTADTTAPSVPTNLRSTAKSTNTVTLAWNAASDNVGVTGYKVYRGGVLLTSVTSTSYMVNGLSPSTLYNFTVLAYDAAGNESAQTAALSVTTNAPPDTTPPTVSITSPANGATVSNTITITANASDNVAITRVEYYRGTTKLGEDFAAPFTFSWNTTTVSGSQVLTAVAVDTSNNQTASAGVTVNVQNSTPPPTDTSAPSTPGNVNGATQASGAIVITWSASTDNTAVSGYKVFRNGTQIGTTGTTSFTDSSTVNGTTYTYTVQAFDAAGNNSGQSSQVSVKAVKTRKKGDVNWDGNVNIFDLSILLGRWNRTSDFDSDLNSDGKTNIFDLSILLGAWGT